MLRTYKFFLSSHIMLHQHVLAFFNRIEFENNDFDDSFFGTDFLDIVNRHPKILRERLINIYIKFRSLTQLEKTALCEQIRRSNDIEEICKGNYIPQTVDTKSTGLMKDLREFFLSLYKQVLDGAGFNEKYKTTLRKHFDGFSDLNKAITKCPICGISELKKAEDETRDQYDHFLPKAIYPFSSVNFSNLVPSCKECNSFDAKGEKDILSISTGKLFFPFDTTHRNVSIELHMDQDAEEIAEINWQIIFSNDLNQDDEINSWRAIYKIDSRYQGFVKGRIEKWYRHYWMTVSSKAYFKIPEDIRDEVYFEFLSNDKEVELDFIRLPSLSAFLSESMVAQASLQAKIYSS